VPYKTIEDLPDAFKNLADKQKQVALKVLNKALKDHDEATAIKMALGVAKQATNMSEGDLPTEDFSNVELAQTGQFKDMNGNQITLTEADFDAAAESWDALGDKVIKVPLDLYRVQLGHDPGQPILASDGMVAGGWVTNVRREGQKLMADFKKVPGKIAMLIRAGAYRTRSIGMRRSFEHEGKTYRNVLDHVALLGKKAPAIKGLDDILALYADAPPEDLTVIILSEQDDPDDRKTKTHGNNEKEVDLMDPKDLAKLLELSEEATEEEINAAIIGLKEKTKTPDDDGKVLLAEDELTQLRSDATKGREAGEELQKMKTETKVDAGIRTGKIYPSERSAMIEFASKAGDTFDTWLKDAPVKIKAGEELGNGENEAPFELSEDERAGMKESGVSEAVYIQVNYPEEHARREAARK